MLLQATSVPRGEGSFPEKSRTVWEGLGLGPPQLSDRRPCWALAGLLRE